MVLLLFVLLYTIIFLVIAYIFQRFRYKLPPGPTAWPIIGKVYNVNPVRFRCFYEWAQTYGPILSFKLGSELNVVVSNGELAKQVLMVHDQSLADRHRQPKGAVTKDEVDFIWADYGPHYVKVRKVCSLALFNPKTLEAHRPIREDEITSMIDSLFEDCTNPEINGKPLTIRMYIEMLSFNNITRITFGKRLINSKGELDSIGKDLKGAISSIRAKRNIVAKYLPLLQWLVLLLPFNKEKDDAATMLREYRDRREQIIRKLVKEQAEAYSKNIMGGANTKQHFVEALLTLKDEYDLTEDIIFWLCWDMIIAGIDTITISIEWALAELIQNPRVQKKAQEELDRVIGSKRIATEKDFSNLPYLQAIVKESLRLHPPTPLMLPHKAKVHVKIGEYDIPKGSIVHVNVWALGRDPNVWSDVNEFRPERFFEESVDIKGQDFRLLPFGAGRRICPGVHVGMLLVTSTLGHLLHHFDWSPPNGVKVQEIDMTEKPGLVTYMSTPLQAVPVPRLPANLYKRSSVDI